jgi:uncharacterized protein involved in exopolysaccharide biosynthesis
VNPPGTSSAAPPERLTPTTTPQRSRAPGIAPADPDSLSIYVAAIRRRLGLVIALPLIFGVVAVGVSLQRKRAYIAHAAFIATEPASTSSSLSALSSVASQLGIPGLSSVAASTATGSAQFYGDLLTSNTLLHAVVTTPFDAGASAENGGVPFRGTLVEYVKADAPTPTDRELATMRVLARSILTVAVDRPTGIVRLDVRTKNRQLSALIARRFLELVNDFNLRRRQTQAGAEREFSGVRTRAALDSLRIAENLLADFRATNIDFSRSPRLGTREAELQRRVSMAQQIYTTVAQRYEIANIEAVRNTPVVTVLDAPEGLVEAQPRYTAAIGAGAAFVGLLIACVIALRAARLTAAR